MTYKVKLEVFEGPLDLLLYLIKKEEIDIYDIPVTRITDQYLEYLELMQLLDLTIANVARHRIVESALGRLGLQVLINKRLGQSGKVRTHRVCALLFALWRSEFDDGLDRVFRLFLDDESEVLLCRKREPRKLVFQSAKLCLDLDHIDF